MWNMENADAVSYYKSKAEEWIFQRKLQNVLIEDDEILDLDSLDLSNNEDTWLYSSDNKSFMDNIVTETEMDRDDEELAKEFRQPERIESFDHDNVDDLSLLNLDSPLSLLSCADFHHNSFLNSIDEMSNSTVENFFQQTPKPKLNVLKKSFSSNSSECDTFVKRKTVSNIMSIGFNCNSGDDDDSAFKKPIEPSYILHSVENKLSNLTDAADTTYLKNVQNREIRNADVEMKDCDNEKEYRCRMAGITSTKNITPPHKTFTRTETEGKKFVPSSAKKTSESNENDENVCKQLSLPVWHSTPHREENASQAAARKTFSLCQPSPVLINRYLKYNKESEDGSRKWRLSNDEFDLTSNKNEMNVSYVTYANDHVHLPCVDCNAEDEREKQGEEDVVVLVAARKSPLNSTFSKSDDVLSCSITEEKCVSSSPLSIDDEVASSTSESSLSSLSAKHPLSIKQVQKMAELQELSLKRHIHSSYYAGSSKSSEVSSSNESVSACGALSSSNEDQLTKPTPAKDSAKNRNIENQNQIHSKISPLCSKIRIDNNHLCSIVKPEFGLKSTAAATVLNETVRINETKLDKVFRSRMSTGYLPTTSNVPQNSVGQRQQQKNKVSTSTLKHVMPKIRDEKEVVSMKEIKLKDNDEITNCSDVKLSHKNAASPVSHIPRPSSKIPMLRTSVSCNRYGKK